jgi:glutathione S-transferase
MVGDFRLKPPPL